jgi:hypothetical protein
MNRKRTALALGLAACGLLVMGQPSAEASSHRETPDKNVRLAKSGRHGNTVVNYLRSLLGQDSAKPIPVLRK